MTLGTPMTSERSTLATWPAAKRLTSATWPAAKRLTDCEGLSDHPTSWRTAFTANFFQETSFFSTLCTLFFDPSLQTLKYRVLLAAVLNTTVPAGRIKLLRDEQKCNFLHV